MTPLKKSLILLVFLVSVFSSVSCQPEDDSSITKQFSKIKSAKLILDEASQERFVGATSSIHNEKGMTPVVFWHGMGDTAYGSINVDRIALQRKFPNLTVFSVQIGSNVFEDEMSSYLVNVNSQIEMVCNEILNNKVIKGHGAFNAVGFSQGAQFLRGLIQRCPLREANIRVKNFISLGGQHQGVFGLPNCNGNIVCNQIRQLLTKAAYEKDVQDHVVQAEYWHDPHQEEIYRAKNIFLADINNENSTNQKYKNNLLQLDNLVLVEFLQDDMVIPRESSLFGFYTPNNTDKIQKMEDSKLYMEDRIGLRTLNEKGKLHLISIPGRHLQYKMSWFLDVIASTYLNN